MLKTVKQVLIESREWLSDIDHWCQDVYAMDSDGSECSPADTEVCCTCAIGALAKTMGVEPETLTTQNSLVYRALHEGVFKASKSRLAHITDWNDGEEHEKAHARVLRAYDLAIEDSQ